MKRFVSTLAIGFFLFLLPTPSQAWLRAVALEDLTHDARVIAVGRVAEVTTVRGMRVARFNVDHTLKGEAPREVYFLAQGMWSCDLSDAKAGESGLFFFTEYTFSEEPMPQLESTPEEEHEYFGGVEFVGFREEITVLTGGQPLLQLAHSGCGRMPARTVDGIEHLTYSHVIMPQGIRAIALSNVKGDFKNAAQTVDVTTVVSQFVSTELK